MNAERMAQLGTVEVPVSALNGGGEPLLEFLEPRQVDLPLDVESSRAPAQGWRVLPTSHDSENLIMLGAPVDDTQWFLAQLTQRDDRWAVSLHGPVPRFPSRAERREGLELRWPRAASDAAVDRVFIDVVNTSATRWTATPLDDFYTIGMLVAADDERETPNGYSYAYMRGQSHAYILDPGEYARVHVSISSDTIIDAGEGEHVVYAAVPALNLLSEHPLPVVITRNDLDRAAPPQPPRRGGLAGPEGHPPPAG